MVLADSHRISRVPCYLGYFSSGNNVSTTGFAPSMTGRSRPFVYIIYLLVQISRSAEKSRNPKHATPAGYHTCLVWPLPRSLATTNGISIDFFSSGYLDVSVLQVVSLNLCIQFKVPHKVVGFPIRKFSDQSLHTAPRNLSQYITSFIGFQCQGIHYTPLNA